MKRHERGAMLISLALVFALVGILFGLGRLLAYKYQVERRVNRMYQLEKVLAVRSMENLIRYTGKPILANDPDGTELYNIYTNSFFSFNSGEMLTCIATPTPYREYQNLSYTNFYGTWIRNCGTAGIVDMDSLDANVARFYVPFAESNIVYRGALIRSLKDSWLNTELGYIYALDVQDGDRKTGFDKIRLYLVGASDSLEQADAFDMNYEPELKSHSWVMMELMYDVSGTVESPVTNTVRKLYVYRHADAKELLVSSDIFANNTKAKTADSIMHRGGLLLSGPNMVGFAISAGGSYAFSYPAVNMVQLGLNTNDFNNVWVVIENRFAKREQVEAPPINGTNVFQVTVDKFTVKQPTTYTLSVYNNKLNNTTPVQSTYDRQVATWIFQTEFPDTGGGILGKQCLLDTVGKEPSSLKRERRGLEAQ